MAGFLSKIGNRLKERVGGAKDKVEDVVTNVKSVVAPKRKAEAPPTPGPTRAPGAAGIRRQPAPAPGPTRTPAGPPGGVAPGLTRQPRPVRQPPVVEPPQLTGRMRRQAPNPRALARRGSAAPATSRRVY